MKGCIFDGQLIKFYVYSVASRVVLLDVFNKRGKCYDNLPFHLWIFIDRTAHRKIVNVFN